MSFTDYLSTVHYSPHLPDWDQLGDRLFLVDGINPNLCFDGVAKHDRIMGVMPQQELADPTLVGTPGTALEANESYRWGVQRVVTIGSLVIPSAVTVSDVVTNGAVVKDAEVTLDEYEYNPETGATWAISYRIYRSKKEINSKLYLVEEIDQTAYDALPAGVYTDNTLDANLDESYTYQVQITDLNTFVPPCRFIRAFRGALFLGGSCEYNLGTATIDAGDKDVVTLASPGQVRECDINASVWIDGEELNFTITDVDVDNNQWTLDRDADAGHDAVSYMMFRDTDIIYETNVIPQNIEGHDIDNQIHTNLGHGEALRGLGVSSDDFMYVFRENAVQYLEGTPGNRQLVRMLQGVGCVSHATIADRYSSRVFWYAGRAGVWMAAGGQAVNISDDIESVITDDIDHSMDAYTHGVYDPQTGWYYLWVFGTDWNDYGIRVPQKLLIYNSRRDHWYLGTLAASASGLHQYSDGSMRPVIGIAGGIAWIDMDCPYDGDGIEGTVTGATSSTLTDSGGGFTANTASLAGLPVYVREDADGTWQRRIVKENTDTEITIYGTWSETPSSDWEYIVGAIEWSATTPEFNYLGSFDAKKKVVRVLVVYDDDASNELTVAIKGTRENSATEIKETVTMDKGAVELSRESAGLRSRSFQIEMSGCGILRPKILSVLCQAVEVKRQ